MKLSKFILSAAFLFALSAPSLAQDQPAGGGQIHQACAADFQKFCPNAQSREDRHQCLQGNKDQLSDDCKAALTSASGHWHHDHGGGQGQGGQN